MTRCGTPRAWRVGALLLIAAFAPSARSQQPADANALVREAREAARSDRNAESAKLFRDALAQDPALRPAILLELAEQMTYAGDSGTAIPLFREVLSGKELSPERSRRARTGLALACSWSEHLGEALEIYRALAAEDPSSVPLRRDLARVLSWRGRNREARAVLEAILREQPDDAAAASSLAQAELWSGRPDLAVVTLRRLVSRSPDQLRARTLLAEIERAARPETTAGFGSSNQSDGLVILAATAGHTVWFGDGRSEIGAHYQQIRYQPDAGNGPNVRVDRPGLHGRHRFDEAWEANGWLFLDVIRSSGPEPSHDVPTFDTWVTCRPSDVIRFDGGLKRVTFDNVKSQLLGLTALVGSLSGDLTPNERFRLAVRGDVSDYSDANRRTGWGVEGEYRVLHVPRVWVGARYTGFAFSEQLDNGYFNPRRFQSVVATLRAEGPIGRFLTWNLDGNAGREFADPKDDHFTWGASGRLTFRPGGPIELRAWYGYFDSRQASSSGFARGWAGASAGFRW